jgi:hypothetical protein
MNFTNESKEVFEKTLIQKKLMRLNEMTALIVDFQA